MPYDISLSTSNTSYGTFSVNDANAFIRMGDRLEYVIYLDYGGYFCNHICDIYDVKVNPYFRSNTASSISTNAVKQTNVPKLEDEIKLLEDIIQDLNNNCSNATTPSNILFLNFRPATGILDQQQLNNYTLKVLQRKLPKINWDAVFVRAFYYNDGVGFEVKTLLDKLKILQMFKILSQHTVTDLDLLSSIEDYDGGDENSPIVFHKGGANVKQSKMGPRP